MAHHSIIQTLEKLILTWFWRYVKRVTYLHLFMTIIARPLILFQVNERLRKVKFVDNTQLYSTHTMKRQ
jgi:hypothetical protein